MQQLGRLDRHGAAVRATGVLLACLHLRRQATRSRRLVVTSVAWGHRTYKIYRDLLAPALSHQGCMACDLRASLLGMPRTRCNYQHHGNPTTADCYVQQEVQLRSLHLKDVKVLNK